MSNINIFIIDINNVTFKDVPVGFIYFQLPNQKPPKYLWPDCQWKDISSEYAGLFFRTIGGESEPFGQIQNENAPKLDHVNITVDINSDKKFNINDVYISKEWSDWFYTGDWYYSRSKRIRFHTSDGEVRPKNMAMKIWQRLS